MLLEELTQDDLDHLLACASQRSVFAAAVAGAMMHKGQSDDALDIKRRIMMAMALGLSMDLRVRDEIEKELLTLMKNHCEEQIAMEDLLDSINP